MGEFMLNIAVVPVAESIEFMLHNPLSGVALPVSPVISIAVPGTKTAPFVVTATVVEPVTVKPVMLEVTSVLLNLVPGRSISNACAPVESVLTFDTT